METLEILAIVGIGVFAARYFGYFKGLKTISKKTAGLLAVVIALAAAWSFNWGGLRTWAQGVTAPQGEAGQTVTAGVTFEAEGASGTNSVYDASTRTFTVAYVENTTAGTAILPTSYGAFTTATGTITVYRTDMLTDVDNAVSKVSVSVPTFRGATGTSYASNTYAAVTVDSASDKYEVAFSGSGMAARYEYNYFRVGSGSSQTITWTATPTSGANDGLSQLDNFDGSTVTMNIYGLNTPFYIRFVKTGEIA